LDEHDALSQGTAPAPAARALRSWLAGRVRRLTGCYTAPVAAAEASRDDLTDLLRAWRRGESSAGDALAERVHAHLRRLASAQLRRERAGCSIQATDLVNETWLRLFDQLRVDWRDRAHFFGLAATMMRRVLVDRARRRHRKKRQGEEVHSGITLVPDPAAGRGEVDVLDVERALERLAQEAPRAARVVEMRYFAGLEIEEVATALDVSPATVRRDWTFARAWMQVELGPAA
jgi:RNA polymerase sigma factor (TIGR02999 family)